MQNAYVPHRAYLVSLFLNRNVNSEVVRANNTKCSVQDEVAT